MRTGWQLVIRGKNFSPGNFFLNTVIQPTTCEADSVSFDEWHDGSFPLDMATEAMDFISSNQEELLRLVKLPGIEERVLSFCDTLQGQGGLFLFDSEEIALLARLNLKLDICVTRNKEKVEQSAP